MASPCNNSPNEVIEAVIGVKTAEEEFERELQETADAAGENAEKFNKFVNGTATEYVQLGNGAPTPTIRSAVRQMLSAAAEIPDADVSGKSVVAQGTSQTRSLAERFIDIANVRDFAAAGDGETDDSDAVDAAAATGSAFLPSGEFAVDALPAYAEVQGPGDVLYNHILYTADDVSNKFPFENCHLTAIDIDYNHKGLNSHLFYDAESAKLVCVYRESPYHGVCVSHYVQRESYDNGQTWSGKKTVYTRPGIDIRCSVSYCGDDAWVILTTNRVPSSDNDEYGMPRSFVSTNKGGSWTIYSSIEYEDGTAINENAVPSWNFHGSIYKFNNKLVAYAYATAGGNIDAFVSEDLGQSWKVYPSAITKPENTANLSETTIAKVGNQLIAFIRPEGVNDQGVGSNCVRVAIGNDLTGLSFGEPFYTQMPLGTNPYSAIIEDDKNRSWVLFTDRKVTLGDSYNRNTLFALLVDSDLIESDFENYKLRQICKTPNYSVGHFWAVARLNTGRYVGIVNAGEAAGGVCAALYCVTEEIPAALSRANLFDAFGCSNLLTNSGFEVVRFLESDTANYRSKYFTDGWKFSHSNSDTVSFEIAKVNSNTYTSPNFISSNRVCTFSMTATTTAVLQNMNPVGRFGFMRPLTLSFWAKSSVSGATILSCAASRHTDAGGTQNRAFSDLVGKPLNTYWTKYYCTITGFTAEVNSSEYSEAGAYDSLNIGFQFNTAGTAISVADVKLEHNSYPSLYMKNDSEILDCNRFYYSSCTNKASLSSLANSFTAVAATTGSSANAVCNVRFPSMMFKVPTVTVYSSSTGTVGKLYNATTQTDVDALVYAVGVNGCTIVNNGAVTAGDVLRFHIIANAQI